MLFKFNCNALGGIIIPSFKFMIFSYSLYQSDAILHNDLSKNEVLQVLFELYCNKNTRSQLYTSVHHTGPVTHAISVYLSTLKAGRQNEINGSSYK